MDLDHFWNFVSSSYPEDHVPKWFEFMTAPFLRSRNQNNSSDNNDENRILYDPNENEEIPPPHR